VNEDAGEASTPEGDGAPDSSIDADEDGNVSVHRRTYVGKLDANGKAKVSAPEITFADMPLVIGYVYSTAYATPGYVPLGNVIPQDGMFVFNDGVPNANANYMGLLGPSVTSSTARRQALRSPTACGWST